MLLSCILKYRCLGGNMKKIIISIFVVLFFATANMTQALEQPTEVTFIYINGSNNLAYKNRLKFKVAFLEDVKKLHPEIKKRFEADETIQEVFLKNGKYVINSEPIAFYWGDRSLDVVETLDRDLKAASKYSPKIAHQARSIFAHCLHDAVWVQKDQNMKAVLDDLHNVINTELEKGHKVVLLGYSAGSFVTYQYYLNKSDSIIPRRLMLKEYGDEYNEIISNTKVKPTCFDALVDADLVKYSPMTGRYLPNKDFEVFSKNYSNLDSFTEKACFKGGDVKGIVGFASPARLFYSDFINPKTNLNNRSRIMAKSIIENDVFYLTVNYSNDPFGFSNSENFTLKSLNSGAPIAIKEDNVKGFIYNKSNNYVPRTFITAHLAYWQTPKRFAKAIVKAFNEGYPNFYGLNQ